MTFWIRFLEPLTCEDIDCDAEDLVDRDDAEDCGSDSDCEVSQCCRYASCADFVCLEADDENADCGVQGNCDADMCCRDYLTCDDVTCSQVSEQQSACGETEDCDEESCCRDYMQCSDFVCLEAEMDNADCGMTDDCSDDLCCRDYLTCDDVTCDEGFALVDQPACGGTEDCDHSACCEETGDVCIIDGEVRDFVAPGERCGWVNSKNNGCCSDGATCFEKVTNSAWCAFQCTNKLWSCWNDVTKLTCDDIDCGVDKDGNNRDPLENPVDCGDEHCTQRHCCHLDQYTLDSNNDWVEREWCYNHLEIDNNWGRAICPAEEECAMVTSNRGRCRRSNCPMDRDPQWSCHQNEPVSGMTCEQYKCERGYKSPVYYQLYCPDGVCNDDICCIVEEDIPVEDRPGRNEDCFKAHADTPNNVDRVINDPAFYIPCALTTDTCVHLSKRRGVCKAPSYQRPDDVMAAHIFMECPLNVLLGLTDPPQSNPEACEASSQ